MRISFLAFTVVALVASTMTAASAFNYASLSARTVSTTIVQDDSAYIGINSYDTDYACYVGFTNGKIDVTFDGGTSCPGSAGTGINAGSTNYFHDVLVITNKGTKTIGNLWVNMTSGTYTTLQQADAASTMNMGGTYATSLNKASLAAGSSIYIGIKIDASTRDTTNSPLADSITVAAATAP